MNETEKKTAEAAAVANSADAEGEKRAKYAKPQLRVYGSVSKLTMGSPAGAKADGALMTKSTSERRCKEGIVRIGEHPLGIGVYLFEYKPEHRDRWGHGRRIGVMVDEVETVMPAAVSMGADGYKKVDYSMLGVNPVVS